MLSSGYYRIPRFQRPYSWDRDNIQDFWTDIVKENSGDYFIGSMVVYKEDGQRFGVVDGQQRLTTITILLCALRNQLTDLGLTDLAAGIHTLIERNNIDNKKEFVVSPESSYPYFQDHIQKWGKPAIACEPLKEELSLSAAFEQLSQLVREAISVVDRDSTIADTIKVSRKQGKLLQIRDALLNLKVIFIKLDDEDDAYLIFETLNTRGKDLTLKDLVKNHLTKYIKAKNPAADSAKLKWEKLIETIEGSSGELDTDTFIHHFWLSRYEYQPAKKLFKVLKKTVEARDAVPFLDGLLEDAETYRSSFEIQYKAWTKQEQRIRRALEALLVFRVEQQAPCVLSLLREYKTTKKLRKKHVEDALITIEKFHFLFTAVTSQHSSGGISAMYAALGRRLFEAADTHAAVRLISELQQKLRDRVPTKDEFTARFKTLVYTDNFTKQRKLIRYILTSLNEHVASPSPVDYEQMTIEHLVPQSQIGTAGLDDAAIGQIGNLLLISEDLNGKLKNKSFKDKKRILRDAGYPLPSEIEVASDWTAAEISARTAMLAEQAYDEVWKI